MRNDFLPDHPDYDPLKNPNPRRGGSEPLTWWAWLALLIGGQLFNLLMFLYLALFLWLVQSP